MATRMQQRRGTASQWTSTNPILNVAEIGYETDTNKFKIGDGINHWANLTYFVDASSIIDGAPALLDTLNELAAALGDDPAFFTTVATNLSNHESDTTNVHGIADTSLLATKSYADSAVSTHSSDTTSVHGITDTAELATKTFAAELLTNATKTNVTITGDKNGLTITAENGVADSTTDNLTEGSTNKYFTDERAQDAVGNAVGNGLKYTDASGAIEPDLALSGGLYIDNSDKLAVDGYYVTFNSAEQTLVNKTLTSPKINEAVELTATSTELNTLDGITASTAELNTLDGITASTAELNTLDGITASTAELNILDGATLSTTELNYVDGVTSAIQTQLNDKAPINAPTFTGTVTSTNDLIVDGDFTVNGTNFAASATSITIEDNLVQIAHNNPANTVDLGLVVGYNDGTAKHAGLVKDTSANTWKLFKGVTTEPATTVDFTEGSLDDLTLNALAASSITLGGFDVATESYVDGAVSGAEVDQSTLAGTGINWNAVDSQFEVDTTLIQARVTDVTDTEIGYLNGVTSSIQTQLNDKLASSTAASTYQAIVSGVSSTEIGYLDGVTSAIQTQLDAKIAKADISAKGAILVGTGAGTYVAQTVGTNGQVLTANSAQADGVEWTTISGYSAPTLGSTSIASGATVTTIAGLTLSSPTITNPTISINVSGAPTTDQIYYAYTWSIADGGTSQTEQEILFMMATDPSPFSVGDYITVTGMDNVKANVVNKQITSIDGQAVSVYVGTGNTLVGNSYNASGQTPIMTLPGATSLYAGTSGQVLSSTGTGVQWITPAAGAAFSELMLIGA